MKPALEQTIKDLQCEYLDLYLIHWPQHWEHVEGTTRGFPKNEDGTMKYGDLVPLTETWKAMEACVEAKLTRNIGLSNFNEEQINRIVAAAKVKPAVLQVEVHPFFSQEPLVKAAAAHNIAVTAYSPLGSGVAINGQTVVDHPKLIEIGQKYKVSAAQVVTAWLVSRGIVVIPKSVKKERIEQNFDVFSFKLDEDDVKGIRALNANTRGSFAGPLVTAADGTVGPRDASHPEFPFNYAEEMAALAAAEAPAEAPAAAPAEATTN